MKMPPKELTVRDIANEVGPDTPVEVIGVYHRYLYVSTDDKHL
jgi:hypothetical protein